MRDCFTSWHTEVGAEDFGARRDIQFMKTYPKKAKEVGFNFTGDLSLVRLRVTHFPSVEFTVYMNFLIGIVSEIKRLLTWMIQINYSGKI